MRGVRLEEPPGGAKIGVLGHAARLFGDLTFTGEENEAWFYTAHADWRGARRDARSNARRPGRECPVRAVFVIRSGSRPPGTRSFATDHS